MACQHWFRWWLGVNGQQAITWTNVDQVLWCHMASLGHNDLKKIFTFGSSLNCIPCFAYPLAWQPGASKTASQARETCLVYVMQSHVGEATFFQAKQVKKMDVLSEPVQVTAQCKICKKPPFSDISMVGNLISLYGFVYYAFIRRPTVGHHLACRSPTTVQC